MKKMIIFEPAMCCSTGVCGPSVNPELLRVSTTINKLKNSGANIERFNLTSSPQEFVNNKTINELLTKYGVSAFPVTMIDEDIVKMGSYPSDEEFKNFLGVSEVTLSSEEDKKGPCSCKGGCC